jgi:multicomponent Na+:H+ antiporter subunit E
MTSTFSLNLILALIWVAMTGSVTTLNFLFGFMLGAAALWLVRDRLKSRRYFERLSSWLALMFVFVTELIKSTWSVVKLAWTPGQPYSTGFIAIPLHVKTDVEITLLANLITLTPGTLSVDVSSDRSTLYIHALDAPDIAALRSDIANGFERRVHEAAQ